MWLFLILPGEMSYNFLRADMTALRVYWDMGYGVCGDF
jgi:hypothetical protein